MKKKNEKDFILYMKKIEDRVKEVMAELLDSSSDTPQDPLNLDASFLELGINSVLAVEVVEELNKQLGIELGVEVMFDYKDVKELAAFISRQYGKEYLSDDARISETIDSSKQTPVPAIEEESPDSQVVVREWPSSDVAIIGISGKFAGSANIEEFWRHLQAGESCIGPIRRDGWETSTYYDPDPEHRNTSISKWGGMLEDIDKFDPLFFNISPLEAARMDPQQRLFLQEAYKAFEDGGYSAEELSDKKVGVFVGARPSDYKEHALQSEEIDSHLFLGSDMAILAARISYFLNFKGPSLTIDTACSSSLVAIHLACESIRTGEAEMALAGGVFVLSSPEFYVMTSKTQMLSPDGKCKTFDNTANGIVIGEGVGAVILKPLEAALEDGDHIYAIIKGSGLNQDGRTKGITAPSMLSQKTLLYDTYKKASVHPETVSYIEAHGTGTKLGDPIEFKALTEAFHLFTDQTQFCAIGSHKPNFGHTIMSAGMAGLFKILMAMKYRQIPPTINVEEVNQQINVQESPFFINTELREWKSWDGSPLRAGVSSFGFSGTNCHVILEEPPPQKKTAQKQARPYFFFPFSAKTKAVLKQKFVDMVEWLEKEGENYAVEDISYTLVHGRSHFSIRYAVVARDTHELKRYLREIVSKGTSEHGVDNEKGNSSQIERLLQEYGHWLLRELLEKDPFAKDYKDKLSSLADLYMKGYNLDWRNLFKEGGYRRVPLPTYPFMGESYWIGGDYHPRLLTSYAVLSGRPVAQGTQATVPQVHPLVQRNTSTLWEQRFSSTFHGDEFFLVDHVVKGQRTLPGVAYLEMVRAAVREAIDAGASHEPTSLHLSNVVWLRPLICDPVHPVTVHITLSPQENSTLSFLISCEEVEEEGGEQALSLLCQGTAELHAQSNIQSIDIPAVQARCQRQFSATTCYQRTTALGINYGPAMQGIEQLSVGEEEVLARLRLPVAPGLAPGAAQTRKEGGCREADRGKPCPLPYVLHPSMLDAALQAYIGLLLERDEYQTVQVPFALDELEIVDETPQDLPALPVQGWAWVRRRRTVGKGLSPVHVPPSVFDIEVCDDTGRVAVRLHGLSIRPLPALSEETQTVLLTPDWKEEAPQDPYDSSREASTSLQQVVLLYGLPDIEAAPIQAELASDGHSTSLPVVKGLPPFQQSRRDLRFQEGVVHLIQELQHLMRSRPAWPVLLQVVVAQREEPSMLEALSSVLKTAQQEYPQLRGQLIEVEGEPEEGELLAMLRENQRWPQDLQIRYRDGKRWVREWQEHAEASAPVRIPWKEGGCYLITGGAGGLARLLVQEIAQHVQEATVILVGRSAPSAGENVRCADSLPCVTGIRIDYQQVDVNDGPAVHTLIQRVLAKSGHLDGIIHAAGVLRDSLLLNKTQEEVLAVLAPKVIGVEQLDEASSQIPLDFFILCSSIAAVMGNVGQADYAAANAYMDAFAQKRQAQVLAGERQGATLSINWPLWEAGGMQIEAETRQLMKRRLGIEVMGTKTGMRTLYQALACGQPQVTVLHGQIERIKQRLQQSHQNTSPSKPVGGSGYTEPTLFTQTNHSFKNQPIQDGASSLLQERARTYFKKQLAALIKLPVQQIEISASLEDYGFDSIMAIRFINALEDTFGPLSKTLLFEYPTLHSITEYFLHSYPEQLRSLLGDFHGFEEDGEAIGASPNPTGSRLPLLQGTPQIVGGRIGGSYDPYETAAFPVGSVGSNPIGIDRRLQAGHPGHRLALLRKGTNPIPASSQQATGAGDIAIIGIAGRYPGARDLHAFWENLCEGRDCITEIPPERWDYRPYFDADKNKPGTTYSKWGGFLEGVDEFDPLFFNISPRDAEMIDPQERLFLECVFATLEDAGYTREALGTFQGNGLAGNVGVFVGVMYEEYQLFGAQAQVQGQPIAVAGSPSSVANRVSYFCNFHGPSLAVDTMCSSSLTAIHLACESIQRGDCELAIAGGVNVSIHPNKYLFLGQGKFVSSQGHCESFGVGADGYVPSEGVGAVLLKPLAQAEEDRDHIYGVIKATAINHGGKTNGYSIPNPHAQAEVIGQALKKAGIDPRTISYIEAHGTGTVLGDPIEIAGLTRAFAAAGGTDSVAPGRGLVGSGSAQGTTPTAPDSTLQAPGWCAIGSVKSNIGHAESAAGMAGVTKVLLQMHYEQLVPSLHAEVLNPHIDFSTTPFVVQQELSEWKRPQMPEGEGAGPLPRRAGISSFGAGGSNAHIILEEYVERPQESHHARPDERQASDPSHPALIVLSARTEEQLNERVRQLLSWMQECNVGEICDAPDRGEPCPACIPNVSGAGHRHWQRSLLDNLAYTLQVGREAMEQRLALLVVSLQELEVQLCRYTQGAYEGGDWYRGQVRRRDPMSVFAADEDGQKAIAAWIRKGKYEKLLSLWVNGASIDWNLLYTVGAGSAQEGTVPTTRTLPCRISLPTYPFAREHYWISTPTVKTVPCACPLPTEGLTAEVTAPPIGIVSPRSSGTSLLSIAQPEAGTSPGQAQAGKDKPQPLSVPTAQGTALTKRVALRPLADHPMPSLRDIGTSTRHSPLSLPADPSEGDQPQPPVMVSLSGQSQSGSNDEAKTGTRTPVVQEATLAAQVLESELTKSLANTLYMNERDVDVEKPFVEMGLDSVIGVEWIQSINKQYASNLGTARIYDYPTIRQLTGLLKKELLKQGGAIQQTPVQAMSTLSLDNVLQQVQQGTLDTKEADKLLQQIIYLA